MLIKYILTQKNPLFKHFCVLNDNVFHILFLIKQKGDITVRRALILCAALIILCVFSGCVNTSKKTVYISGDIECEASWAIDGTTYRAVILRSDDLTQISFEEPRALLGVVLTHDGENMSATLDGMEINDGIERLFEIEKFFEYDTAVLSSDFDGGVERLELKRSDGEMFTLILEGGLPTRIEGSLYGERREIKLIRIVGEMAGE